MAGFAARVMAGSWMKRYESLSNRMAKVREKAEETIGHAFQSLEVGGTTFAFSYVNAMKGAVDPKNPNNGAKMMVFGLDADLIGAVALHGVAFFGGLGRYAEHGHNVGDGALASYLARLGTEMGADAKLKASQPKQVTAGSQIVGASQYAAEYNAQGQPVRR